MLSLSGVRRLDAVAAWCGRVFPWLIPALAALTFGDVVLRYGFDFGRIALQEGETYLHAFVLMLCMSYTLHRNEHVRVDIFYAKMTRRRRAVVNLAGALLFLAPMCVTILVSSWNYVAQSWSLLEGSSEAGGLPLVFLLKTMIPAMAVLLLIQAAAEIARNLGVIRGS